MKAPVDPLVGELETTGKGKTSEGLKGPGKPLLRGVETAGEGGVESVGEGIASSENCKGTVGSIEEKCDNKDGLSSRVHLDCVTEQGQVSSDQLECLQGDYIPTMPHTLPHSTFYKWICMIPLYIFPIVKL